jgi:hypothetical protein
MYKNIPCRFEFQSHNDESAPSILAFLLFQISSLFLAGSIEASLTPSYLRVGDMCAWRGQCVANINFLPEPVYSAVRIERVQLQT